MKVSILSNLTKSNILFENFKLNAIVKKILLAGDKFMREMHSRQQRFHRALVDYSLKITKELKKI